MNEPSTHVETIDAEVEDIHIHDAAPIIEHNMRILAQQLRKEFASRDQSRIEFNISISGNPHSDLKIEYAVGNFGKDVRGNRIMSVVQEFFRRLGWDNMHKPEALTYTGEIR